ncbi:hypothetical protein HK104_011199 [Borealophlyctis nickersoniae]|nr:hypothetical protein HK104_011199 [Borealophlyctis nickersoniae]
MSLFNQLVYFMLIGELSVFLLSLIPLHFIPLSTRKTLMNKVHRLLNHESVLWGSRIIVLIVFVVFADTVNRLYKISQEIHSHDHDGVHHHAQHGTLADIQYKSRLALGSQFYAQRNLYLSLFAIIMILVVYRRMKDIYIHLLLQEQITEQTNKIRILKAEVEKMALRLADAEHGAGTITAPVASAPAVSKEKVLDGGFSGSGIGLEAKDGARKRAGGSGDGVKSE